MLGVNQSSSSTARVVGPIAAGWGFGALGPALGFLAGGVLIAVAALFAALLAEDAARRVRLTTGTHRSVNAGRFEMGTVSLDNFELSYIAQSRLFIFRGRIPSKIPRSAAGKA